MKLGIALSGGGIRGIAHAGVLKALEDNNIKVDIIGGTSSGSLVASLYAMGYSPYYIYILFKKYSSEIADINSSVIISGVSNFMRNKRISLTGLKSGESLEKIYNEISVKKGIRKIGDIKMPIVIPTVDIMNSKEYIFTNIVPKSEIGNEKYITNATVGKAVRASSSFPAVFSPCKFEKHAFMDGGVLNNVPADEVRKQGADKVISVKFTSDEITTESNIMDIVMKTVDIMGNKISEESLKNSDFVLDVFTDKTGLLDVQKLDICYKFGYNAVIQNLDKIKEIIRLKTELFLWLFLYHLLLLVEYFLIHTYVLTVPI